MENTLTTLRIFIGQGYHHGKRFLGHLDNAYRTGSEIYKIIEPALKQVAPETTGQANRHFNKLDNNYNNIKNKVLDAHGQQNTTLIIYLEN